MDERELILLYLVTNAFRTYSIYLLLRLFWDRGTKISRLMEFLTYFIFYMAVSVSYLWLNNPITTQAVNICGLLLMSCIYRLTWKSRIIAIVFCYAVLICAKVIITLFWEYVSFTMCSLSSVDTTNLTVAANLLPFAFALILSKTKKTGDISFYYRLTAVFMPASSIYLIAILVASIVILLIIKDPILCKKFISSLKCHAMGKNMF